MNFLTNALENTHINDALDVVLVLYDSDIVKAIDLSQQEILAFDCEGVDFGRPGKVCIVQLSTRTTCYLFDVLGLEKNSPILLFLKSILESTAILKIIHDCKTDSDALYHLSDIKICNCHDTQVWDRILFNRQKGFGLNQTLALNDCPVNDARDPQMYQRNNAFWAKRPLTKRMIAWASGDVSSLFELYDKQITIATEEQRLECQIETERSEAFLRDCLIKVR